MNNDVYIVDIATLLPPRYPSEEILAVSMDNRASPATC